MGMSVVFQITQQMRLIADLEMYAGFRVHNAITTFREKCEVEVPLARQYQVLFCCRFP